jgi:hypothetical protein
MIQRIQTLFLILAAGSAAGQFFAPYLSAAEGNPSRTLPAMADGALTASDNPGMLGLCALVALLTLGAVFLYNNRPLQGRISAMAGIAALFGAALTGIQMYQTMQAAPEGGTLQMGAGIALPVLAILFTGLAGRYIRKDEKLVRSADRLR